MFKPMENARWARRIRTLDDVRRNVQKNRDRYLFDQARSIVAVRCFQCGEAKPATPENWKIKMNGVYHSYCMDCYLKRCRQNKEKLREQRAKARNPVKAQLPLPFKPDAPAAPPEPPVRTESPVIIRAPLSWKTMEGLVEGGVAALDVRILFKVVENKPEG